MKIKQTLFAVLLAIGICVLLFSPIVLAAECGGADTAIINCSQNGGKTTDVTQTGIWALLELVINIMTAGVGIAATGGIVYGSILYASSSGNVEQTKRARAIILNVVIGIVAYALTYAFLNWLIPGGIFS